MPGPRLLAGSSRGSGIRWYSPVSFARVKIQDSSGWRNLVLQVRVMHETRMDPAASRRRHVSRDRCQSARDITSARGIVSRHSSALPCVFSCACYETSRLLRATSVTEKRKGNRRCAGLSKLLFCHCRQAQYNNR